MSAVDQAAAILGGRVRRDVPIGVLTTYRVGGAARLFLEACDDSDLRLAQRAVGETGVPTLVIGKGSNMLVADRGFDGLAIVLGEHFASVEVEGVVVRCGAASALPVVARRTAAVGLTGFEWAVGVPGSIGGAVRMNAGGHGADMSESLSSYSFVDLTGGDDGERQAEALAYGYRSSSVAVGHVITGAELRLAVGDRERAEHQIAEIVRWRRANQPGGQNAGSVFTNPAGDSAGRLIDAAGLKGLRLGSAHVSPKHANFVQAEEGGSADDVMNLVEEVQRRVQEETGVRLEPELRLIGFHGKEA